MCESSIIRSLRSKVNCTVMSDAVILVHVASLKTKLPSVSQWTQIMKVDMIQNKISESLTQELDNFNNLNAV